MKNGSRVRWGDYEGTVEYTGIGETGAYAYVEFDTDAFGDIPWDMGMSFLGDELAMLEVL